MDSVRGCCSPLHGDDGNVRVVIVLQVNVEPMRDGEGHEGSIYSNRSVAVGPARLKIEYCTSSAATYFWGFRIGQLRTIPQLTITDDQATTTKPSPD
jgi:hypothetical protein